MRERERDVERGESANCKSSYLYLRNEKVMVLWGEIRTWATYRV